MKYSIISDLRKNDKRYEADIKKHLEYGIDLNLNEFRKEHPEAKLESVEWDYVGGFIGYKMKVSHEKDSDHSKWPSILSCDEMS